VAAMRRLFLSQVALRTAGGLAALLSETRWCGAEDTAAADPRVLEAILSLKQAAVCHAAAGAVALASAFAHGGARLGLASVLRDLMRLGAVPAPQGSAQQAWERLCGPWVRYSDAAEHASSSPPVAAVPGEVSSLVPLAPVPPVLAFVLAIRAAYGATGLGATAALPSVQAQTRRSALLAAAVLEAAGGVPRAPEVSQRALLLFSAAAAGCEGVMGCLAGVTARLLREAWWREVVCAVAAGTSTSAAVDARVPSATSTSATSTSARLHAVASVVFAEALLREPTRGVSARRKLPHEPSGEALASAGIVERFLVSGDGAGADPVQRELLAELEDRGSDSATAAAVRGIAAARISLPGSGSHGEPVFTELEALQACASSRASAQQLSDALTHSTGTKTHSSSPRGSRAASGAEAVRRLVWEAAPAPPPLHWLRPSTASGDFASEVLDAVDWALRERAATSSMHACALRVSSLALPSPGATRAPGLHGRAAASGMRLASSSAISLFPAPSGAMPERVAPLALTEAGGAVSDAAALAAAARIRLGGGVSVLHRDPSHDAGAATESAVSGSMTAASTAAASAMQMTRAGVATVLGDGAAGLWGTGSLLSGLLQRQ
jgi:hypothetical protein